MQISPLCTPCETQLDKNSVFTSQSCQDIHPLGQHYFHPQLTTENIQYKNVYILQDLKHSSEGDFYVEYHYFNA